MESPSAIELTRDNEGGEGMGDATAPRCFAGLPRLTFVRLAPGSWEKTGLEAVGFSPITESSVSSAGTDTLNEGLDCGLEGV